MGLSQDIALENNDLVIVDGDFAVSESDEQHIADTINAFPGWWKENPPDGVGIFSYMNSSGQDQALARSTKIQLTADGYQVGNPAVSIDEDGLLNLDPRATRV